MGGTEMCVLWSHLIRSKESSETNLTNLPFHIFLPCYNQPLSCNILPKRTSRVEVPHIKMTHNSNSVITNKIFPLYAFIFI